MKTTIHTKTLNANDLIIAICRRELAASAEHVDLSKFTQWQELYERASLEGCTGLIYCCLRLSNQIAELPKNIKDKFEQEHITNTGRNLLINSLLNDICCVFEKEKLQAICVRGATFFDSIYPDIGMRPLIDMDFVIDKNNFVRTRKLLSDLGFQSHDCYPYFFFKDDCYVDVHLDSINFWRIKNWPSAIKITNPHLLQRTKPFRNYQSIRTLDCYDAIIHSCEHLVRHSFERLIWFIDIIYLIQQEGAQFSWDYLAQRIEENKAQKATYYCLAYLQAIDIVSIPDNVLQQITPTKLNSLEQKNVNLLKANQRTHLSGDLLSLFAIPGFWLKIQALLNGIFIEKDKFPLVRKKLGVMSYFQRFMRLFAYFTKKLAIIFTHSKY